MNRLANIFIGFGLFVGMIAMYTLGIILTMVFGLSVIPFFVIVVLIEIVGVVFAVLFCLAWLLVGLVGLLTTGSTSWLKHLRISNVEDKVDKGFNATFEPMCWWLDRTLEPIAFDGCIEAGEYCRKRLIRNGDFTNG
jgi:hypothetical protein